MRPRRMQMRIERGLTTLWAKHCMLQLTFKREWEDFIVLRVGVAIRLRGRRAGPATTSSLSYQQLAPPRPLSLRS